MKKRERERERERKKQVLIIMIMILSLIITNKKLKAHGIPDHVFVTNLFVS